VRTLSCLDMLPVESERSKAWPTIARTTWAWFGADVGEVAEGPMVDDFSSADPVDVEPQNSSPKDGPPRSAGSRSGAPGLVGDEGCFWSNIPYSLFRSGTLARVPFVVRPGSFCKRSKLVLARELADPARAREGSSVTDRTESSDSRRSCSRASSIRLYMSAGRTNGSALVVPVGVTERGSYAPADGGRTIGEVGLVVIAALE
jgi:hypothetical protein